MPQFTHLNHNFHYEIGGAGKPVIAIPGMMSDSASWGPVVTAMQARHLLIRPDPRCSGRSPTIATSVEAVASDIIALMDHLRIGVTDVISHSMGSRVALHLAQTYPNRINRMVLSAVMPRFPALNCAVFESLLRVRTGCPSEAYLYALFPWLFGSAFFEDRDRVEAAVAASVSYPYAQSLEAMRLQVKALKEGTPVHGMSQITTQTLALFGNEDRLVPVTTAPGHLATMPNLKTTIIDGAGHAIHWDQPEAFVTAVCQFLDTPN